MSAPVYTQNQRLDLRLEKGNQANANCSKMVLVFARIESTLIQTCGSHATLSQTQSCFVSEFFFFAFTIYLIFFPRTILIFT